MELEICKATVSDILGLVACTRRSAAEAGQHWLQRFEQAHAERHMARLVVDGHCFIAKRGTAVVGLIACLPIDVGFMHVADLETAHIYVVPEERKSQAVFMLFGAVEAYASRHGLKVLFHQADYLSAIDGRVGNGSRVETLFKRRRYQGPVDILCTTPDFIRVGLTYLFDAAKNGRVPDMRLGRAPEGHHPPRQQHEDQCQKDSG